MSAEDSEPVISVQDNEVSIGSAESAVSKTPPPAGAGNYSVLCVEFFRAEITPNEDDDQEKRDKNAPNAYLDVLAKPTSGSGDVSSIKQQHTTPVVERNYTPCWNHKMQFFLKSLPNSDTTLHINVVNKMRTALPFKNIVAHLHISVDDEAVIGEDNAKMKKGAMYTPKEKKFFGGTRDTSTDANKSKIHHDEHEGEDVGDLMYKIYWSTDKQQLEGVQAWLDETRGTSLANFFQDNNGALKRTGSMRNKSMRDGKFIQGSMTAETIQRSLSDSFSDIPTILLDLMNLPTDGLSAEEQNIVTPAVTAAIDNAVASKLSTHKRWLFEYGASIMALPHLHSALKAASFDPSNGIATSVASDCPVASGAVDAERLAMLCDLDQSGVPSVSLDEARCKVAASVLRLAAQNLKPLPNDDQTPQFAKCLSLLLLNRKGGAKSSDGWKFKCSNVSVSGLEKMSSPYIKLRLPTDHDDDIYGDAAAGGAGRSDSKKANAGQAKEILKSASSTTGKWAGDVLEVCVPLPCASHANVSEHVSAPSQYNRKSPAAEGTVRVEIWNSGLHARISPFGEHGHFVGGAEVRLLPLMVQSSKTITLHLVDQNGKCVKQGKADATITMTAAVHNEELDIWRQRLLQQPDGIQFTREYFQERVEGVVALSMSFVQSRSRHGRACRLDSESDRCMQIPLEPHPPDVSLLETMCAVLGLQQSTANAALVYSMATIIDAALQSREVDSVAPEEMVSVLKRWAVALTDSIGAESSPNLDAAETQLRYDAFNLVKSVATRILSRPRPNYDSGHLIKNAVALYEHAWDFLDTGYVSGETLRNPRMHKEFDDMMRVASEHCFRIHVHDPSMQDEDEQDGGLIQGLKSIVESGGQACVSVAGVIHKGNGDHCSQVFVDSFVNKLTSFVVEKLNGAKPDDVDTSCVDSLCTTLASILDHATSFAASIPTTALREALAPYLIHWIDVYATPVIGACATETLVGEETSDNPWGPAADGGGGIPPTSYSESVIFVCQIVVSAIESVKKLRFLDESVFPSAVKLICQPSERYASELVEAAVISIELSIDQQKREIAQQKKEPRCKKEKGQKLEDDADLVQADFTKLCNLEYFISQEGFNTIGSLVEDLAVSFGLVGIGEKESERMSDMAVFVERLQRQLILKVVDFVRVFSINPNICLFDMRATTGAGGGEGVDPIAMFFGKIQKFTDVDCVDDVSEIVLDKLNIDVADAVVTSLWGIIFPEIGETVTVRRMEALVTLCQTQQFQKLMSKLPEKKQQKLEGRLESCKQTCQIFAAMTQEQVEGEFDRVLDPKVEAVSPFALPESVRFLIGLISGREKKLQLFGSLSKVVYSREVAIKFAEIRPRNYDFKAPELIPVYFAAPCAIGETVLPGTVYVTGSWLALACSLLTRTLRGITHISIPLKDITHISFTDDPPYRQAVVVTYNETCENSLTQEEDGTATQTRPPKTHVRKLIISKLSDTSAFAEALAMQCNDVRVENGLSAVTVEEQTPVNYYVCVKVVKGTNLPIGDVSLSPLGSSIGSCDPYIVITVEGKLVRSRTLMNTLDPVWDHQLAPIGVMSKSAVLHIECWDYDTIASNDFLGAYDLNLAGTGADRLSRKHVVPLVVDKDVKVANENLPSTVELEIEIKDAAEFEVGDGGVQGNGSTEEIEETGPTSETGPTTEETAEAACSENVVDVVNVKAGAGAGAGADADADADAPGEAQSFSKSLNVRLRIGKSHNLPRCAVTEPQNDDDDDASTLIVIKSSDGQHEFHRTCKNASTEVEPVWNEELPVFAIRVGDNHGVDGEIALFCYYGDKLLGRSDIDVYGIGSSQQMDVVLDVPENMMENKADPASDSTISITIGVSDGPRIAVGASDTGGAGGSSTLGMDTSKLAAEASLKMDAAKQEAAQKMAEAGVKFDAAKQEAAQKADEVIGAFKQGFNNLFGPKS